MAAAETQPASAPAPAPASLSPSPFSDPAFFDDPYPFIHRLRREDPVHLTPFGFWFVTSATTT